MDKEMKTSMRYAFYACILVVAVIALVSVYNTQSVKTITVCSKERVSISGGGEYRVYAAEGAFVMKDSLIGKIRYSTADAYARIKPKTTYKVTVKGLRVPFLSLFPNILEADVVPANRQSPDLCDDFA